MQSNLKLLPKPAKRFSKLPILNKKRKKNCLVNTQRSKSSEKNAMTPQIVSKNSELIKRFLSPMITRKLSENYIEKDTNSVPRLTIENLILSNNQKRTKSEQKLKKISKLGKVLEEKTVKRAKKIDKTKLKDQEIKKFNKDIKELRTLFGRKSRYFKYEKDCKKTKKFPKNKDILETDRKKSVISRKFDKNRKIKALRVKSAIKIQSCFRGYLTRKTIKHFLTKEPSRSQKDINYSLKKNDQEPSITLFSYIKTSLNAFQIPFDLSTPSFYSKSLSKDSLWEEASLVAKQKEQLKKLEKEDINLVQEIMDDFQIKTEQIEKLNKIIKKRYRKIYSYFDDWILKLKMNLKYLTSVKNFNSSAIIRFYSDKNKKIKKSEALCNDIENIWQQIDKIQKNTEIYEIPLINPACLPENLANFSKDFFEGKAEEKKIDSFELLQALRDPKTCSNERVLEEDCSISIKLQFPLIKFSQESSSMSLENSRALQDYSSIKLEDEKSSDPSSLKREFELMPKASPRQTMWPSGSRSIFERDSPSNPLSVTNKSERPYDLSGENLVVDRVVFILETLVYNDLIEDQTSLFSDAIFTVKITEDFLTKMISSFIKEALRPRLLRQSTNPSVRTDTESLLRGIDLIFTNILQKPGKFKERLQHLFAYEKFWVGLRNGEKNWHGNCEIIQKGNRKIDAFSEVHEKCIIDALTELFIRKIENEKCGIYDIVTWKIHGLKLAEILVDIRNTLADWNDFKAGNLPSGETIRANGELDESKLFMQRKKNLNNMIFEEINEQEGDWVNYIFEEEQILEQLDKEIISVLFDEIIKIC